MKRSTAFAVTLVFGLAACGGADESDDTLASADSLAMDSVAAPAPMEAAPAGMGMTAQLAPLDDSGIAGEVTVTDRGAETEVLVRLTGAEPNGTHPGHVHSGTCDAIGGVVQPLQEITVDASGTGTMTTNVAIAPATIMDGNHIVVYHSEGAPATCAAIPGHAM